MNNNQHSISKEDVINCYRYILGREPENEKVIGSHLDQCNGSFSTLRRRFLNSNELKRSIGGWMNSFDFSSPSMEIENCNTDQKRIIFENTQETWKKLGDTEPYFSVRTSDKFKKDNLTDARLKEFYESGIKEADLVAQTCVRNGLVKNQHFTTFLTK